MYLQKESVASHLARLYVSAGWCRRRPITAPCATRSSCTSSWPAAASGSNPRATTWGTNKLLLLGTESIRTATGKDYFPEATAYYTDLDGACWRERKWHVRLASDDATAFLNVISVGPEVASNLLAANKLQIGNHTIEFQGQQVQIVSGNPGENRFPTAQADSATTLSGAALTINVLANDSDPDGDLLSVAGFTQPAHGTVTQVSGGLRYTPASGYAGADSFTYTISDGRGGTATATVSVTVQSATKHCSNCPG